MLFELNMYHTCAIAALILMLGEAVKRQMSVLRKFCIPVPVVGGLIFTLLITAGYLTGSFEVKFNATLSDFFSLAFYSGVGFTASLSTLKKGGIKVFKYLMLAVALVVLQNAMGVGISMAMGINPLVGLATGSIPMTGGHGTSAAFAPELEKLGLASATTISLAAATFGLVAGSLCGGPIGRWLTEKHCGMRPLRQEDLQKQRIVTVAQRSEEAQGIEEKYMMSATYQVLLAMAFGSLISAGLKQVGFTFPASVGAMTASAIFVNVAELVPAIQIRQREINCIGNVSLMLFLAMSMMTLKLWQLVDLAVPMLVLLVCQSTLMLLFAAYVTFPVMGKNYAAAMMACGHCGFGLGAVPTAMANMKTMADTYGDCHEAFFIVPLVGSLFINFFNSIIITAFMNFLA
ncbi:MAG: sodium/glutamate symporter [Candidatus Fimivivens sp.]|nr:sodium/glutamate symporter [Candidatus Fimivivens sp.]